MTLYLALTGQVPRGRWRLPSEIAGTLPELDAVVRKAMNQDCALRHSTAEELRQDLARLLEAPAGKIGASKSLPAPNTRQWRRILPIGTLLLGLASMAIWGLRKGQPRAAAAAAAAPAASQPLDPALGTVARGTQGHFYQVIRELGVDWQTAERKARSTLRGTQPGHLATIASEAENQDINALFQATQFPPNPRATADWWKYPTECWIGGIKNPQVSGAGAGWSWIGNEGHFPGTNSTTPYARWLAGEPNGTGSTNVHLGFGIWRKPEWNDEDNLRMIAGYIVEWDVPATVVIDGRDTGVFNALASPASFRTVSDEYAALPRPRPGDRPSAAEVERWVDRLVANRTLSREDADRILTAARL